MFINNDIWGVHRADLIVRSSLLFSAYKLNAERGIGTAEEYVALKDTPAYHMKMFIKEARLDKLFGHRKSAEYRWSKTEDIRKILYKISGYNGYAGLNCDQYRAFFCWCYLTGDKAAVIRVLFGYVCRLGFSPSLTEYGFFKPQSFVLALATIHPWLKYLVYPFYLISERKNLRKPINEDTSGKITLLLTMKLLGRPIKSKMVNKYDIEHGQKIYIDRVYETYFRDEIRFIGNALVEALA